MFLVKHVCVHMNCRKLPVFAFIQLTNVKGSSFGALIKLLQVPIIHKVLQVDQAMAVINVKKPQCRSEVLPCL